MDPRHFDALSRVLSTVDSRRGLLAFLPTLPVLGSVFGILSPEETEAAGRRKRRKKRHKRRSGSRKKNHKGKHKHKKKPRCTPESVAQTCANTCGSVANNCQQAVNCGSCACNPSCATCFTCQDGPHTPGTCVVDPDQVGSPCGSAGQVCQADGACACVTDCSGRTCGADGCGGSCGTCPTDQTCQPNGACLQNLNQFQCLCGDSTTPAGCVREQCQTGFDTVCSGLCTGHGGYYGLGTPGTGCGPGACTP